MQEICFEVSIYPFQIDFMDHVSNIVYIQWMEMGRCHLLDAVDLSVPKIAAEQFGPVLVETQIAYKKPLRLGDRVKVQVWLTELTAITAWINFAFSNQNNEICATGRQRGLFVDLKTGRPKRMSDEIQDRFRLYLKPDKDDEKAR